MKTINKKLWPDYFDVDKNTPIDFKLADFDLQNGDQVKFQEWDTVKEEYTGREYVRTVKRVSKHKSPTRYWKKEDLEKFGMYIIEWK